LGKGLHWELDHTLLLSPDPGARERLLTHLEAVSTWQTADDITTGTGLKRKTVQNVLSSMMKQTPRPVAVQGTGRKNDPRRYHTPSPHLEGFGAEVR
jgi:hypothetical protein